MQMITAIFRVLSLTPSRLHIGITQVIKAKGKKKFPRKIYASYGKPCRLIKYMINEIEEGHHGLHNNINVSPTYIKLRCFF